MPRLIRRFSAQDAAEPFFATTHPSFHSVRRPCVLIKRGVQAQKADLIEQAVEEMVRRGGASRYGPEWEELTLILR
ncbi:hypothetical protein GCM10014715_61720 [Streptomyces spiralis]|uniref:Uncharacterized protein n=2 Tax=Streptomyces spiralis TaxID=66376 RepID=A0A919ABC3_9ACTN|nr:hypothetical protein GCM10014715_61720 [Streptomyces spiralis]